MPRSPLARPARRSTPTGPPPSPPRGRPSRAPRLARWLAGAALLAALAGVAAVAIASSHALRHSVRTAALTTARPHRRPHPRPPAPPPPPPQLPRGGRVLLPGHLIVAYYGVVGTANILGHTGNPEDDAAGVERQARAYAGYGWPVQPAFEMVATVAKPTPGADGTYSAPIDMATVARYLAVAHEHRLLLILDFQPGRGEFLPEVRHFARFLRDPSVGVGLDPEWKLGPTEYPDEVIGSSSAASINAVSTYLSALVRRDRLPQKLFVVHQFRLSELPDRSRIAFRPGLATVLQMDGFGAVKDKLDAYRAVARGAWGFHMGYKLFTDPADDPLLMSPAAVMALHPRPVFMSYQ